jgi:hypothetical protein
MTTKLSGNDYQLLGQLSAGPQTISGNKPHDGADRLVAAGYAESRSLNPSVVEYGITARGRTALLLKDFGVLSTRVAIEPHRHDVDGLWYLNITSEGNPALMMGLGSATRLLDALRRTGADDIANDFDRQLDKAYRYAGLPRPAGPNRTT